MTCPYTKEGTLQTGGSGNPLFIIKKKDSKNKSQKVVKGIRVEKRSFTEFSDIIVPSAINGDYVIHCEDLISPTECGFLKGTVCGIVIPYASSSLRYYSGKNRYDLMYQVALGIAQMHINGFLHLDIKPDNVLVFGDKNARISDFGLTVYSDNIYKEIESTVFTGTYKYIVPARWNYFNETGKYLLSYRNDIQSLGLMFLYLSVSPFKIKEKYISGDKTEDIFNLTTLYMSDIDDLLIDQDRSFVSLIKRMISRNPPTAEEVINDKFFTSKGFKRSIYDINVYNKIDILNDFSNSNSVEKIVKRIIRKTDPFSSPIKSLAFDLFVRTLSRVQIIESNEEINDLYQACILISQPIYRYISKFSVTITENIISMMREALFSCEGRVFRKTLYYADMSDVERKKVLSRFVLKEYDYKVVSLNWSD
jgi:serine/threonine protein kinase